MRVAKSVKVLRLYGLYTMRFRPKVLNQNVPSFSKNLSRNTHISVKCRSSDQLSSAQQVELYFLRFRGRTQVFHSIIRSFVPYKIAQFQFLPFFLSLFILGDLDEGLWFFLVRVILEG